MWPGMFWYKRADINWELLNFHPQSQVRLVGKEIGLDESDEVTGIQSVFFGERSRYGILVSVNETGEFGVNESSLTNTSPTISVVCRVAG